MDCLWQYFIKKTPHITNMGQQCVMRALPLLVQHSVCWQGYDIWCTHRLCCSHCPCDLKYSFIWMSYRKRGRDRERERQRECKREVEVFYPLVYLHLQYGCNDEEWVRWKPGAKDFMWSPMGVAGAAAFRPPAAASPRLINRKLDHELEPLLDAGVMETCCFTCCNRMPAL